MHSPNIATINENTEKIKDEENPVNNSKIQEQFKIISMEKEQLIKVQSNLENQVSKYALLLSEEKSEKKDILNKFESLQNIYNEKIEGFGIERVNFTKRYYTLLVLCAIILVILTGLVLPNILDSVL